MNLSHLPNIKTMKKIRYFLLLTMLLVIVSSCHRPSNVLISTEKWVKQEKGRYRCELTNQYSTEQRRNMYPFNKAETVLFIAYENHQIYTYKTTTVSDTTYLPDGKQLIFEKRIDATYDPCTSSKVIKDWQLLKEDGEKERYCAIESIKLNQAQIDSLSNLLLNHQISTKGSVSSIQLGCYFPRNTIIFLDKAEKPIGFIEICFECLEMHGSNTVLQELAETRLCLIKLSRMEELFKSVGIHYGIDNR